MSNYSFRHGVEGDRLAIYAAFVGTGRGAVVIQYVCFSGDHWDQGGWR